MLKKTHNLWKTIGVCFGVCLINSHVYAQTAPTAIAKAKPVRPGSQVEPIASVDASTASSSATTDTPPTETELISAESTATPDTSGEQPSAADVALPPPPSNPTTMIKKDPYESFNRVMYHFNDFIDTWILKPVAELYNKITPKPLNKGITNFFNNLDNVPTVANDVLQGNLYQASSDAWRLGLNSSIGVLGLFDVATPMGLEPNVEDFGLTLAQWGYKNSNYLVLPFFGPSTVRDGIGIPINYYFLSVYPYIEPPVDRYRLYALSVVDRRADLLGFEDVMQQAAIDKYTFIRDAYLQRRNYLIQRNTELGNPYLDKNNKIDE
jgi:phospholipid-binding lipoprotein MlaA